MTRRNFNAEFKTKVVLEALQEVNTSAKSEAELEKEQLMRKIGELTVEIDFLKKRLP